MSNSETCPAALICGSGTGGVSSWSLNAENRSGSASFSFVLVFLLLVLAAVFASSSGLLSSFGSVCSSAGAAVFPAPTLLPAWGPPLRGRRLSLPPAWATVRPRHCRQKWRQSPNLRHPPRQYQTVRSGFPVHSSSFLLLSFSLDTKKDRKRPHIEAIYSLLGPYVFRTSRSYREPKGRNDPLSLCSTLRKIRPKKRSALKYGFILAQQARLVKLHFVQPGC